LDMIPVAFEYKKAASVEEAISALKSGHGTLLAGGHSLLPSLKLRLNQSDTLVDIAGIPALKGIQVSDGVIIIGAAATHHEIATHPIIREKLPFFSTAASLIGDRQVRNRGTIGGSLAHADPAADWSAPVLASNASISVQGPKGKRMIKAADFFKGLFSTALEENEIIVAVHIPVPAAGSRTAYLKFPQPASRFALVGCAVMRSGNKVNIAFTGVSENAFRDTAAEQALAGKELNGASIEAAAKVAAEGVSLLQDHYATESYRKHLAKVYLKRALQAVM